MEEKSKQGGARKNAGAPLKCGEKQIKITLEIPESIVDDVRLYIRELKRKKLKPIKVDNKFAHNC
mgnify:CR=1 FL=1